MNPKQSELPCRLLGIDQISFLIEGMECYTREVVNGIKKRLIHR